MAEDLDALLSLHQTPISTLLAKFSEYETTDIGVPFDAVFVLRFLLSAKLDLAKAQTKIQQTVEWRVKNLEWLNEFSVKDSPDQVVSVLF
jgi:hypothetical protein